EPNTQHLILSYAYVRAILFSEDEAQESKEDVLGAGDEMDDNPQSDETQHQSPPPQGDKPTSSTVPHPKASKSNPSKADIHYANLKASIEDYYNENIAHRDQTDQLVEASMSSFEKSSTTITDLYKGLEVITQVLKDIKNLVKDDLAANKKIEEASKTLAKISSQTTDILSLVRSFDFSTLLKTSSIKSMITKMYNAFRGQSSLAPPSSVTLTFAITVRPANVEGENATHITTKEPPSHTEGEIDAHI
nr:hypothetical protein [Tanacetum cinerariifolium]